MAVEIDSGSNGMAVSRHGIAPDIRVFESVEQTGGVAVAGGEVALAPYRLVLLNDPLTERHQNHRFTRRRVTGHRDRVCQPNKQEEQRDRCIHFQAR